MVAFVLSVSQVQQNDRAPSGGRILPLLLHHSLAQEKQGIFCPKSAADKEIEKCPLTRML
jgi:hypothetical protein